MTERREPRLGVLLTAFVGVCALADVSPLAKLRPPSAVFGVLAGEVDRGRASLLYGFLIAGAVAAPVLASWWVARGGPLPGKGSARFLNGSVVLAMFAVARFFEPRLAALRAVGRGSDQSDCIVMPARALAAGHWPYDRALIWTGNACSPGMGWILLAMPFVLLAGYASFLVAGAGVMVALPERVFGARAVTTFFLLLLSCVTAWQSLATGADDLAIGIAIALVTMLSEPGGGTIILGIAAGVIATARLPFVFVPFVLAGFVFLQGERRRAWILSAVALGTLCLLHGIPLALDTRSYLEDGPFHVLGKAARLGGEGGAAIFFFCALAWIGYALWSLRRASEGPDSRAQRLFDLGTLTLLCVAAPALADLFARAMRGPSAEGAEALEAWQGGNWLLAALPCYAASLAARLRAPVASAPGDTSSPLVG